MKKVVLFFVMSVCCLGCFSQTRATVTTTASVVIIRVEDLLSKYKIPALASMKDSLRVVDSLQLAIQAAQAVIPTPAIEIGFSRNTVIQILGYPIEKVMLSNNKEKWVYSDQYIYFNNGAVDVIQKLKK